MPTIINGTSDAITFPDSTIQNTSAIVSGKVPKAALPTGSVLQVVQISYSTLTSTTSATFTDSGLSASITPTSSSSQILVLVNQQIRGSGRADPGFGIRLVRNSTAVFTRDDGATANYINASDFRLAHTLIYLDSPATTSSTTYKTQINSYASGTITAQNSSLPSTITLLEIAA